MIMGDGFAREAEIELPTFDYTAAMQAADGVAGSLAISVRQAGDHGLSRPAAMTFD